MKIAIVGSRKWPFPEQIKEAVKKIAQKFPDATIVSGGARGVDTWAEQAALEFGLTVEIYPADWSLGRHAGFLRNQQIVDAADRVLAFWAYGSRGTKDTIDKARRAGKRVVIVKVR